jgi:hypothetical protein
MRMWRLAQVRPLHIALACGAWAGFVVLLPRLTLLAVVVYFRVRAVISPARNWGVAFGGAYWTSRRAMIAALAVPPALLLCAWTASRLMHREPPP